MKTIIIVLLLMGIAGAQTVYNLQPGTKGNQIKLTVANISDKNNADNVVVNLLRKSTFLKFENEADTISLLEAAKEKEATFRFEVKRNAPVNIKDSIEFSIGDVSGIMMMKTFVLNFLAPSEFRLEQNFPNPFNPATTIQYQLPAAANVTLKIYDILGSEVAILVNEKQDAGYKEIKFNANRYASGMYIYRLTADKYVSTKKMLLLKQCHLAPQKWIN